MSSPWLAYSQIPAARLQVRKVPVRNDGVGLIGLEAGAVHRIIRDSFDLDGRVGGLGPFVAEDMLRGFAIGDVGDFAADIAQAAAIHAAIGEVEQRAVFVGVFDRDVAEEQVAAGRLVLGAIAHADDCRISRVWPQLSIVTLTNLI